jgi:hypothetical protein
VSKRNLIFVAAGNPIEFHDEYDKDNHWRYTKPQRDYDIMVAQYGDYEPDPETYDIHVKLKGPKWVIVRQFIDQYWELIKQYEYVGFFDDDLITDIQSINRSFEIARKNDFKLFQLSTLEGSASAHYILHQNNKLSYSRTNFIEGMSPTFHTSLIPIIREFMDHHEVKSGWGFDLILGSITRHVPAVMHEVSVYHPNKQSYYDTSAAHAEMNHILHEVYPKFMRDKYESPIDTDMDWSGNDTRPKVYEVIPKE